MLYLSYRGLCFGWGWNCYLLLEGFEDAPEGYSFRCNCFLKDWLELLLSLLTSSTNLSINLPRQPENRSPRIKSSIFVIFVATRSRLLRKGRHEKVLILTQLYKTQSRQNQQLLMSAFSNILLQSRSSEATNIGYRISSRAVFGQILFELNSSCGDLGERVEIFCLL